MAIRRLNLLVFVLLWLDSVVSYTVVDIFLWDHSSIQQQIMMTQPPKRPRFEDFMNRRQDFVDAESARALGSDITLNGNETKLNEFLMQAKLQDLARGIDNPPEFLPSRHLFEVLNEIDKSFIFNFIRKMPKGGVLHAHDTALCNLDFVVKLTYWSDLWQTVDSKTKYPVYKFARTAPSDGGRKWRPVAEERERVGAVLYDTELRKSMSLFNDNPLNKYRDVDSIWERFMEIFGIIDGIVQYKDAWAAYYKQALKEFFEDGVQYLEIRSVLPKLYDLDGNSYDEEAVVQIYHDVTNEYKAENPEFIGGKLIYAPLRVANDSEFLRYLDVCKKLYEKFPDFMVGFDLVGQEDCGRPLIDFAEQILTLPPSIKFYFHAGETNWNGKTDDNLIDAVLLGTQRIGHGFALTKHPKVLELIKEKGIAIEVNPVSNQVLRLVADYRNHPATVLFSDNYPVVVSCDDPSFWETKPLSHDFYMAFLGIATSRQDLRFLKRLAMNSIAYSAMTPEEKTAAIKTWTKSWNRFVKSTVKQLTRERDEAK